MDTRRLISAVLITMMIVFAYQIGLDWLAQKKGWERARPQTTQTDQPGATTAPATAPTTVVAGAGTQPAATTTASAIGVVRTEQPTRPVHIGSDESDDPRYRLGMSISAEGAGIDSVILNEFTRQVGSKEPYVFQTPLSGVDPSTRSMTTRAIVVDGTQVPLDGVPWILESSSDSTAVFALTLQSDSGPLIRVRKTFQIFDKSAAGDGYEIVVEHSLENLTDRPITARLITNGPVTPPREVDRGPDRYIVSGYTAPESRILTTHHAIEEFSAEKRTIDITTYEQQPLMWAGAVSVYFVGIARPDENASALFKKVDAVAFNPQAQPYERDAGILLETTELQLQPAQATSLPMRVFFGPRQRKLLKDDYYARLGYNQILVLTGGPCAYCTFQWLIDILVLLLRAFHWVFGGFAGHGDWGLAIIALVVLVRIILHPITKKSQISMMKMSKLGPEIERLRKKYGDDKDSLNKEMMKFYKEQGATPILGCLPMFLQMPIWIALWSALNSTFELRHASFLWGYTWIKDLAKPDHLITFSHPFDIWFLHISGINLLPILMGVVFYLQMKLQPKPVTMTKEQEQQQKIMMWMMPLLFPLMLYSGPSGLNLYILTSTFIGIIESKVIRDHIKQREEAEKAGKVIVDAPRGMKRRRDEEDLRTGGKKRVEIPRGGLGGWLAQLQSKVEDIRREADKRKS